MPRNRRTLSRYSMEQLIPTIKEDLCITESMRKFWQNTEAFWINYRNTKFIETWLTAKHIFKQNNDGKCDLFKDIYATILPKFGTYIIIIIKKRKVKLETAKRRLSNIISEFYEKHILKHINGTEFLPPAVIFQPRITIHKTLTVAENLEIAKCIKAKTTKKMPRCI